MGFQSIAIPVVPKSPLSPGKLPQSPSFRGDRKESPEKMALAALEVEEPERGENYRQETVLDIVKSRWGWLIIFFGGLMVAAVVVEAFENVLEDHVALSYFVPLLIGHGGNTGSQSCSTVIRALALGQVRPCDALMVVRKEALAGAAMGGGLGLLIYACSFVWEGMPTEVGLVVAVALPVVSVWANILGGTLPLISARLGFNPAVTSAPLMTTIVDASGLVIYFLIAKCILDI